MEHGAPLIPRAPAVWTGGAAIEGALRLGRVAEHSRTGGRRAAGDQGVCAGAEQVTRAARRKESLGRIGRRHGPASVFAEAMANTLQHADSGGKGAHHWWAAVCCDEHGRPACFAAVDAGVGS